MRPPVSTATRLCAVLGDPVEHSLSPAIHGAALDASGIDAQFVAHHVGAAQLGDAVAGMRALGYVGASITVPHKQAVMDHCDVISDRARRIGAVNCLKFVAGKVHGDNTDAPGFVAALGEAGVAVGGQRIVLLGGGGAARAVWAGLIDAGAAEVVVSARRPDAVSFCAAQPMSRETLAPLLHGVDLVVDCTSAALEPSADQAFADLVDLSGLPSTAAVSTLVYHRATALLSAAASRGLVTVDGAGMLVHQGAIAFGWWFGQAADTKVMSAALRAAM